MFTGPRVNRGTLKGPPNTSMSPWPTPREAPAVTGTSSWHCHSMELTPKFSMVCYLALISLYKPSFSNTKPNQTLFENVLLWKISYKLKVRRGVEEISYPQPPDLVMPDCDSPVHLTVLPFVINTPASASNLD